MREVRNYDGIDNTLTCVTKGGILELNKSAKTLQLIRSSNGETADYALSDYEFSSLSHLICDHPGEGHALVRGKNKEGKEEFMMINLMRDDPMSLVFNKFPAPFDGVHKLLSSRYMGYFLLTFENQDASKIEYVLLNPGDKEIRVKADSDYEIKFEAKGHSANGKHFTLDMSIKTSTLPETKVEQFPGQYTAFNEKRVYDLDNYLKFLGPVKEVDVIVPAALKTKVQYLNSENKRRIEVIKAQQGEDATVVIPSA